MRKKREKKAQKKDAAVRTLLVADADGRFYRPGESVIDRLREYGPFDQVFSVPTLRERMCGGSMQAHAREMLFDDIKRVIESGIRRVIFIGEGKVEDASCREDIERGCVRSVLFFHMKEVEVVALLGFVDECGLDIRRVYHFKPEAKPGTK